jgi:hypothetical protein
MRWEARRRITTAGKGGEAGSVSGLLDSLGRALGIGSVPVNSQQAFSQYLNWGFVTVAGMLVGAFTAIAYRAVLPQGPVWLNVVMWFVAMAAPVYAGTKALTAFTRYVRLRIRERRGV